MVTTEKPINDILGILEFSNNLKFVYEACRVIG